MTDQEQRQFIRFLAKEVKDYYRELAAYRVFAQLLKDAGVQNVDEVLEVARISPAVQNQVKRHFEKFDELLPETDEEDPERTIRDFLERWKPDGDPN